MTAERETQLRLLLDVANAELAACEEDVHLYDPDMDDERSIIEDACELLARSPGLRFIVTGFSTDPWPVDVGTDLAVVLEQLPAVVSTLRARREATIEFYEQGIERTLLIRGKSEMVEVECRSQHSTWQPSPSVINIGRADLLAMLLRLGTDFCDLLGQTCNDLADHSWMRDWRRRLDA